MAKRRTKAQLVEQIGELEKEIEDLKQKLEEEPEPPEMATIALTYGESGSLAVVAASHMTTAQWLGATKGALSNVLSQVDMVLLTAVGREAGEKVRQELQAEADAGEGDAQEQEPEPEPEPEPESEPEPEGD